MWGVACCQRQILLYFAFIVVLCPSDVGEVGRSIDYLSPKHPIKLDFGVNLIQILIPSILCWVQVGAMLAPRWPRLRPYWAMFL